MIEDEPTYRCADCLDTRFMMVACSDPTCRGCRSCLYPAHRVARPCPHCEAGQVIEAGRWFDRIYPFGHRGRHLDELQRRRFETHLDSIGPAAADGLRQAFDRIFQRERTERMSVPT